ncbi:chromogranin-A [Cololabis saira]|uniref:chromogranin-A n=1 Tax=Cololabis saira TaxID=129043 RepID=UPI002AD48B19|nr:chromogranin-A [Cololabis saira]
MIARGLFVLTVLSNCVLSLPMTSSQLENEDVEVMKCIVEALADVLSRPHHVPVTQECLVTLKTDDRLVTILRHHNFLKELQEIALQGGREGAQLQRDADAPTPATQVLHTAADVADRSMLDALGGPGERSILSQRKRTGKADGREEDDESAGDSRAEDVQVKRGKYKSRGQVEKSEGEAEREEYNEKRGSSEEKSERENETKDKKGDGSDEKRDASRGRPKGRKFEEEDKEEKDKRSTLFSQEHSSEKAVEEKDGAKRGSGGTIKRWTKRAKPLQVKKKMVEDASQLHSGQKEVPHHSKELLEEDEEEKKKRDPQRSPEEKELQMIARRSPEVTRGMEEEGSASRKSEEPEIESLAAIESELENVAQKLHELRRG